MTVGLDAATLDAERYTGDVRWNFAKFLIASIGTVTARSSPDRPRYR